MKIRVNQDEKEPSTGTLGSREAAAYLQISVQTLYDKTSRAEIPFHKNGSKLIFYREELDDYIRHPEKYDPKTIAEEYCKGRKKKAA